jgi:hypothetical protein
LKQEQRSDSEQLGEPVAWLKRDGDVADWGSVECGDTPLYTTPQPAQKPWVGLTEQEQGAIMEDLNAHGTRLYDFSAAIEAKLKEKNT